MKTVAVVVTTIFAAYFNFAKEPKVADPATTTINGCTCNSVCGASIADFYVDDCRDAAGFSNPGGLAVMWWTKILQNTLLIMNWPIAIAYFGMMEKYQTKAKSSYYVNFGLSIIASTDYGHPMKA